MIKLNLQIAICDDNKFECETLYNNLLKINALQTSNIDVFTDSNEFINKFKEYKYDIVFMDVELENDKSGLQVALEAKLFNPSCLLIYISSHDKYYTQMVKADPFYFLHKPITEQQLFHAVNLALKRIYLTKNFFTYVYKFNGVDYKLNLHDVLYFESIHRVIRAHLKNNTYVEFYEKLDVLEKNIDIIYPYFLRASKSYLVNFHFCNRQKDVVLINDISIKITVKYKKEFEEKMRANIKQIFE